MYKLLIVDDEKEIRDGLAAWSWSSIGIDMAGTCSHGLEALQFMAEQAVDIVLTDIRMPFMDGIGLLEALRSGYPFVNVLILSGYGDFEYAQQALRLGAVDYLLKPVQFPALWETMGKIVDKLGREKQSEYRMAVLKRKAEMLTKVLRHEVLGKMLQGKISDEEREQGCSEGEMILEGDRFCVAAFRPDRMATLEPGGKEFRLLTFSMDNILSELWRAGEHRYYRVDDRTGIAYLLSMNPSMTDDFEQLIPHWRKYKGLFKSAFTAGVGHPVGHPSDIWYSARTAERALAGNLNKGTIACWTSGNEWRESGQLEASPFIEPSFGAEPESTNLVLHQAKQFIKHNYERSLTIKEVAEHVNVSPSHLFALFKSYGETFLKYLTSIRMKHASKLLLETNLRVYEIVEKVGYSDPAYFTEVFKKTMGATPQEYRERIR